MVCAGMLPCNEGLGPRALFYILVRKIRGAITVPGTPEVALSRGLEIHLHVRANGTWAFENSGAITGAATKDNVVTAL